MTYELTKPQQDTLGCLRKKREVFGLEYDNLAQLWFERIDREWFGESVRWYSAEAAYALMVQRAMKELRNDYGAYTIKRDSPYCDGAIIETVEVYRGHDADPATSYMGTDELAALIAAGDRR